jgi:integrase/recombinase XerD
MAALQQWVDEGRAQLVARPDDGALFLNHRGQRLTRQGLWLIIRRYVRQAAIESAVTPHTLRQSFAAHQLYAGADAEEVAELLGVAGAQSTRAYRRAADALLGDGPLIIIDGAPLKGRQKTPDRG